MTAHAPKTTVQPDTPPTESTETSTAAPTVYGQIVFSRELGRGVSITSAPLHTKISVGYLVQPGVYIHETAPGTLRIADQVDYQITGYDPADATLTLQLAEDHRPKDAGTDAEATP